MNPTFQKTLVFSSIVGNTVNRTGNHRLDIGGKGANTCRVLTQLGKPAVHLTQLGGATRPLYLELCQRDGITVQWVESGSPIRFCYTLINNGDESITELVEESDPVDPGTEGRILDRYMELLPAQGFIIISGTKARGFSDALVPLMVRRAKETGTGVMLDLRGTDLLRSLEYRPDLIKPNLFEFAQTFAPELIRRNEIMEDEKRVKAGIREICRELCEKYQCRIVLTRGAKAVWLAEGDRFSESVFEPVKPVNPIGSGDAFTAGLAAALGDGAALEEAAAQGIRCGKLNTGFLKVGTIG
ncbi:MAG: PfkB family carbohydrate kinase [Spirochaetaceae bacterium]|jgi:1-phosphofructokinase/tagatose 6-phosphate kinase|nr:PfkB family carbohydrate kinase [Spirochaetaceae bacterium]